MARWAVEGAGVIVTIAELDAGRLVAVAAHELALFAALGYALFAIDDLLVDLVYFARRAWRALTVYSLYPRQYARSLPAPCADRPMAVLIPAWDESDVIGDMLRATLRRFGSDEYRLFVGYYPNDPATAAEIAKVEDRRLHPVCLDHPGPTTKGDCLNALYAALCEAESREGWRARAVVLHDAEDLVHPDELRVFSHLIDRAALVQLPVIPLLDEQSPWVSGHYADEFAEAHGKELIVREAVGATVPLAGVGCAIARDAIAALAERDGGRPFADVSLVEDYELGLRLGALGHRTLFVRMRVAPGRRDVVCSRGHFPASLPAAVRQKSRWVAGIAFAGWPRLGWRGGLGERWFRMRDRRGPLAGLLLLAGYAALFLLSQIAVARGLGATIDVSIGPVFAELLTFNAAMLAWRYAMRIGFTARHYGWREGMMAVPRLLVANIVGVLAVRRAIAMHLAGTMKWEKTAHVFPAREAEA